jgi:threonylcarbamoyladenosine tRNA methylthiotransferase MtaB
MKRRYQRELYESKVAQIRKMIPNACIGVDVIVGHPGETEDLFLETYSFLTDLEISYLHVFSYSERPNTFAVDIMPKVHAKAKNERSQMLHILSDKKRRAFYDIQIGKKGFVLFEDASGDSTMSGFSENYIKVSAAYDPLFINTIQPVRYKSVNEFGEMVVDILSEAYL